PQTLASIDPATQLPTTTLPGELGMGVGTSNSNSSGNNSKSAFSFLDQPLQNTQHNYVFAHGASGFAKNPAKALILSPEEDRAYFS
ncbi:hypothetical protein BGZ98_006467, partial [Dissophora globulifera]